MVHISKTRLEAFSDGVFAILITLLVLELKVPPLVDHDSTDELLNALVHLLPRFVSWVISFLMIAVIWVNHHRLLELIDRVDHRFFWLNANLLLWTSFIPFPTALIGEYAANPLATFFFGIILSSSALAFVFLRGYLRSRPAILKKDIDREALNRAYVRSMLMGPLPYLGGAALSWVSPVLSWMVYAVIPLVFIFPVIRPVRE